jgi:HAD superfamily hydrolase (TIGR01509 family)
MSIEREVGGSAAHAVASVGALIFDMDGTMVDSMPSHAESWLLLAQRHGIAVDLPELMRRTTGRTGLECIRILFERDMPDAEAQVYVHEKETLYREIFAPKFAEVQGFSAFAEAARARGLQIGVGTAGDRHNVAFAYANLALRPLPAVAVGGDEGLPGKPAPDIFLEVARRLGVDPAHCIVFEDAPLGIEAARRAGMRAVGICTGHSAAELAGDHVLAHAKHFTELSNNKFLERHHVAKL